MKRNIAAATFIALACANSVGATTYEVGPGRPYANLQAISGLTPGDLVLVDDFWPGPCEEGGDGIVDEHELEMVLLYWGTDCSESFGPGGPPPGGGDLVIVQQCILEALAEDLTGEAFVAYLLECLCEHEIIECD